MKSGVLVVSFLILAAHCLAEPAAAPESFEATNSTLESVFDDVLAWGQDDGVITKEQQATLSRELSRRLVLIRDQPGTPPAIVSAAVREYFCPRFQ